MKYQLKPLNFSQNSTDCLILGIQTSNKSSPLIKALSKHAPKLLSSFPQLKKPGHMLIQPSPIPGNQALLLVNFGSGKACTAEHFRKTLTAAINHIKGMPFKTIGCCAHEIASATLTSDQMLRFCFEAFQGAYYSFQQYKTKPSKQTLKHITFLHSGKASQSLKKAFTTGAATASGMTFTQDLANTPGNVCTPSYLAKQAKALAKQYPSIKASVIEEAQMKKMGMGAFLSVSQGSVQPAKLITMQYNGAAKSQKPIVLVGKGITFDTGGTNLKPFPGMVGMKYDMCGAATVFGMMKAAAEMKLKQNIVGVVAASENMPGGKASKPEDVVTTMSGQTVEILNTDAEGRLVLCDTLTYVKKFKPKYVIDMATLTGAIITSLGSIATGVFSNHQPLADKLLAASHKSCDKAWQLPIWDEYQELLKSPIADFANLGTGGAGSITAACFLARFTKDYHWAHLDIAGTAFKSGLGPRHATGRPVPMLMEFLLSQ